MQWNRAHSYWGHYWPIYQHRMKMMIMMDDDDENGAIGGKIVRGSWSTRRKPAPASLCPPQIPHDLTRARNLAVAVRSLQLTAWAMARPYFGVSIAAKFCSDSMQLWINFSSQKLRDTREVLGCQPGKWH
jgi:hypothetical protein